MQPMQFYSTNPWHDENNAKFIEIVNRFGLSIFQPNPKNAPWHFQAIIEDRSVELLNFWPHKLKGQRDGHTAVEGELALISIIEGAIEDASQEPFDVIEG